MTTPCSPGCDYSKAKKVARATWVCAACGRDISLGFIYWYQAAHPELFNEDGELI